MFAPSTATRRGFVCALATVLVISGCAAGRDAQTQGQIPTQDGTDANVGSMALRGISLVASKTSSGYPAGSAIPVRIVLVNNGTGDDKLTNIVTSVARGWAGYATAAQAAQASSSADSSATPASSGPSASSTPGASTSAAASATKSGSKKSGAKKSGAGSTKTTSSSPSATPTTAGASSSSAAETAITIPAGQRVSFGVPDSKRVLLLLSSLGHVYPGSTVRVTFTFSRAGSVTAVVPVQTAAIQSDPVVGGGSSSDG